MTDINRVPSGERDSFNHHIFISYARASNKGGWVTTFHNELDTYISFHLVSPRIFRDENLDTNTDLPTEIIQSVEGSAVFVPIMAPVYSERPWCQAEANRFLKISRDGERINYSRIFKVLMTFIPNTEQLPEGLSNLKGTDFFDSDAGGTPQILDPRFSKDIEGEFLQRINKVAVGIAKQLKIMQGKNKSLSDLSKAMIEGESILQRYDSRNFTVEERSISQENDFKKCIYLAEASLSLMKERRAIERDLDQKGYEVIKHSSPFFTFQSDLEQDEIEENEIAEIPSQSEIYEICLTEIKCCVCSVHLIGKTYGTIPDGFTKSIIELQYDAAKTYRENNGNNGNFYQIVWTSSDLNVEDLPKTFLEKIESTPDFLQTTFEDFKTIVGDRLQPTAAMEVNSDRVANIFTDTTSSCKNICLVYQSKDELGVRLINDYLFEQKCDLLYALLEESAEQIDQEYQKHLQQCDQVIIYWGEGTHSWVDQSIRQAHTILSARFPNRACMIAVYIDALSTSQKRLFRKHGVQVIPGQGNFPPDELTSFITSLNN